MALLENDIYIGSVDDPLYHYTNRSIQLNSAKGIFSLDVIGNELPIDTFTVTIRYDPLGADMMVLGVKSDTTPWDGEYLAYLTAERTTPPRESASLYVVAQASPANYLNDVPYGTAVYWYISNSFYAKGYLKSVERTGRYTWKLTCISGVGLLDTKMHSGGLYNGIYVGTLINSIVGGTFAWDAPQALRYVTVYGHLPYDTARNNLHRLMFAVGMVMRKSTDATDYVFQYLASTVTNIPASRISINGSVNTQLPANKVEIAEHAFFQTAGDEVVTLFDNTGGGVVSADHQLVVFDKEPVYGLTTTGTLTVNESNCNYAIVTGTGVLTGKLYQHTIKIVELEDNPDNAPIRVKRVENNEIVSAVNSRNVARRVLNFYKSTKTVKGKIMLTTEKTGDYVQATDAFGDMTQGYLHKVEVTPTSVKGANVEIIDGYVADANGNNFTQRELITTSGTWTAEKTGPIRLIIMQGGTGGQGGYDGKPGLAGVKYFPGGQNLPMDVAYTQAGNFSLLPNNMTPEDYYDAFGLDPGRKLYYVSSQPPQAGGAAGAGGAQGKVFVIDLDVTVGDVITFSIGRGGAGGGANGGAGTAGTHTTATINGTTYTSADGNENGYYDPLAKQTYGIAGKKGYKGGNGGTSGGEGDAYSGKYSGCDGGDGVNGGSVAGFQGGQGGAGTGYDGEHYPETTSRGGSSGLANQIFKACGSGGGGAAYGNNGQPGETYSVSDWWVTQGGVDYFYGFYIANALGGAGADALAPAKASYGNGGDGGNGGGAGGNASGVWCDHAYFTYNGIAMIPGGVPSNTAGQTGAPGGSGSAGGDGGDGCAMIYS